MRSGMRSVIVVVGVDRSSLVVRVFCLARAARGSSVSPVKRRSTRARGTPTGVVVKQTMQGKRVRPSTVEGGNEGANTLFGTVDTLFDTVDREGVGNEEGANLLLLPPLWSALLATRTQKQAKFTSHPSIHPPTESNSHACVHVAACINR